MHILKIFLDILCEFEYNITIWKNHTNKESSLETSLVAFGVFSMCLIGCGIHAWYLGRRAGIEHTVDYLVDTGQIEVDE